MKWYNSKLGKTQIICFFIFSTLNYIVQNNFGIHYSGSEYDKNYSFGFYILGPFCWIFLPTFIISLFTSSDKVKLISVYIMFGLGMFSLLRLLPGHGLSI